MVDRQPAADRDGAVLQPPGGRLEEDAAPVRGEEEAPVRERLRRVALEVEDAERRRGRVEARERVVREADEDRAAERDDGADLLRELGGADEREAEDRVLLRLVRGALGDRERQDLARRLAVSAGRGGRGGRGGSSRGR